MMKFCPATKKREIIFLALLFVVALLPRLYRLGHRDVWMDEYKQSKYSRSGVFNLNMVQGAAKQAQPPLDASLQSIVFTQLGQWETGLRVHSALMGALAALFFLPAVKRLTLESWYIYPFALVIAIHPWLVLFSQEGRPASTALLFSTFYLLALIRFMTDIPKPGRSGKKIPGLRWLIVFTVVQVWFILSIGFQPFVFILTSGFALFPYLFTKRYRLKVIAIYIVTPISFLLAYPVLKLSIDANSSLYLSDQSFFEKTFSIFKRFFQFSIDAYTGYFSPLLDRFAVFFLLVCFAGISGWIILHRKKNAETNSPAFVLFPYFIIFTLLFPQAFDAIFKTLIHYPVKTRYFVTFTPVLMTLGALSLYFSVKCLKSPAPIPMREQKWRPAYLLYGILSVIFLISLYTGVKKTAGTYRMENRQWKKVYELFTNYSAPGDQAYIVNLVPPGKWAPPGFYCSDIYYNDPREQPVVLNNRDDILSGLPEILDGHRDHNIYLVFHHGFQKLKLHFFNRIPHTRAYHFSRLYAVRLLNRGNHSDTLSHVFHRLFRILPRDISNHFVYQVLFHLEVIRGNREKARKYFNVLSQLDKKGILKETIGEMKNMLKRNLKNGVGDKL